MAIAAIAVGAFGVGAYRLLSQQISEKVARDAEKRLRIANAIHKIDLGLIYWHFYRHSTSLTDEARLNYLDEAIEVTKKAFSDEVAGLREDDREVGRLLLEIRNNWAYYVYEKSLAISPTAVETEAMRLALSFVDYVDARREDYPDLSDELTDTIDKARGQFS